MPHSNNHQTTADHTECPSTSHHTRLLAHAQRQADLPGGIRALRRLLKVAQGNSGQGLHVAAFLLGLYNGSRFKVDLTNFRLLDAALFDDCMTVLRMDYQPAQEVHCYFLDGGRIWGQLAKDWDIRDFTQEPTATAGQSEADEFHDAIQRSADNALSEHPVYTIGSRVIEERAKTFSSNLSGLLEGMGNKQKLADKFFRSLKRTER